MMIIDISKAKTWAMSCS